MNALVSLDNILEPAPGTLTPANLFGTGAVEAVISAIEKDVRAEAFDVTTPEGRDHIKSVAYKIARSKTTLDDIGKEHVAEIKKQSAAIDAERRIIRDRLDALKDEVRRPVTDWEEAEETRVSGHECAIVEIIDSPRIAATMPSANAIKQRIEHVRAISVRDWQEFHERAEAAATEALAKLEPMLAAAVLAERDAVELEALRKEKAEREAADRIMAETAARAERERQRAEQAKRDQEAAAARAVEQERQRVAAQKAADEAAERRRQENKRHREKVHKAITLALSEILTGDHWEAGALIKAIDEGRIPHVRIEY